MPRVLRSMRFGAAIAALVAFNVLALIVLASVGSPEPPLLFVGWFVGDAAIGLVALALTESR